MRITEAMVDAAMRKAIEAGLLTRRGTPEEMAIGREVMHSILRAAFEVAEQESPDGRMRSYFLRETADDSRTG